VLDGELEAALCERTLRVFEPLFAAGRLSCLVLQLTPAFRPGDHALAELEPLVQALAPVPVAIELRHRDWLNRRDETLGWFREAGAAFVCVDAPRTDAPVAMPPEDAVTRADLAYLRAHGRNAEGYQHGRTVAERFGWEYSDDELQEIGGRAQRLAQDVPFVRIMFNNNRGADAPHSARRLRELLHQVPPGETARQQGVPPGADDGQQLELLDPPDVPANTAGG
jgi:uncharacterized protein YecE (DUF72 family)